MGINRELADRAAVRFRCGEEEGFEHLVLEFQSPVYRYFLSSLHNAEDALELTQELFIRVYRGIAGFSGGSVCAWVFRIARNLLLDFRRSSGFRRIGETLPVQGELLQGGESALELLGRDEITTVLHRASLQLPAKQRDIFSLFYFHHLTVREAAEAVGCSEANARVQLFRARKRLSALPEVAALKEAYNEMQ